MPPTLGKRPFAQEMPEPAPEPIQTSCIVIIQPGSYNLRIGRASDTYPETIPHCIARRHNRPGAQTRYEDSWLDRPECRQAGSNETRIRGLQSARESIQFRPMSSGQYRQPTSHQRLCQTNNKETGVETNVKSPVNWTDTSLKHEYLIGDEALYVNPKDCYDLHWPIRKGRFNLHGKVGGTLSSVIQDLEDIWRNAIQRHLDIPTKDLQHYRAVLLIPDIYCRQHIRELMNVLLFRLGFGAAFVVQESMCATFGAGVGSACVVDIGDQKTSVCCIEDGISQKNTRVTMDYGGSDITRCFHWLLTKAGFPYKQFKLDNRIDALFINAVKESCCHLDQDLCGVETEHLQIKQPGKNIRKYNMLIGDERLVAPMSVFLPEMYGFASGQHVHVPDKYSSDPSDPRDEDYLKLTMSKHEQAARRIAEKKKGAPTSQNPDEPDDPEDDDTMEPEAPEQDSIETDPSGFIKKGLMGIDQVILHSIDKCDSDDMKRRMYSCVLVVGGGLSFPGAQHWIQYLIWTQMPAHFRLQLESMDIITRPKDLDPHLTCWKGASLMCCLDTAQELWIRKREWKRFGVKVLRERAPFVWIE